MAKRWMRGVSINTPGTTQNGVDHTPSLMLMYHFLTKLLGFTHVDEQVTGGPTRSFLNGHEATASDGVLTAVDLTFSSASNPFTAGSVGKFLAILDPTNPENCGIHEIATYVGAGQVTINFYVPGGTFPTAAGGLTWWMFDTNNASYTPTAFGDYFVVRSSHATYPFEMYVESDNNGNYIGASLEYSPNAGAWDAVGHAWNSGARVLNYAGGATRWMFFDRFYNNAPHSRWYMTGDTDGSFVLMVNDRNAAGVVSAALAAIVDPLETTPARSENERLVVGGYAAQVGGNVEVDRGDDQGGLGLGQVWEDYGNQRRWVRLMSLTEEGVTTDYFSRNVAVNSRTGERDALPFMYSIEPEGGTDFHRFAPHSKVPIGNIVMGTAVAVGELTPFDSDDYFHVRDGIVIPWNGLPQA
jgi:hypothetical protein